jgi:hypothetical protein
MKNSMIENLNLGNLKIGSKTFCFLYTKMIVSAPTTRAVHESRQVLLKFLIFRILHFRIFQNLDNSRIENYRHRKLENHQIKKFTVRNEKLSTARAKRSETTILVDRKLNPMDGISR